MSVTPVTTPAVRAIEALWLELEAAGIESTRDAGAFYPQPTGVLVGLPSLVGRTLGASTFEISVLVVSGDALNSAATVDRLYTLADQVAAVLSTAAYRVSSWRGSPNAEPLPALELTVTATVDTEG